jgi:hypothetical protein
MRDEGEVEKFENEFSKISRKSILSDGEIEGLLSLLEDDAEQQDVLWGVLHRVEAEPLDGWIKVFVSIVPTMARRSPEWSDTITSRILNGKTSRDIFAEKLRESPEAKEAILPILRELSQETSPRLQKSKTVAEEFIRNLS